MRFGEISHIVTNLYLSDLSSVRDMVYMHRNSDSKKRIGIVSIGDFPDPKWSAKSNNISSKHFGGISDFDSERFANTLPWAIQTIDKYHKELDKVIVHCFAGINRSPSLVIGWMMTKKGYTFASALSHVESKRPIIQPHPNLTDVLKRI